MKTTKLYKTISVGILFAVLGSSVFADDRIDDEQGPNWKEHIVSTKTRAQVREELNQSVKQGQTQQSRSEYYVEPKHPAPHLSRAEVRAEAAKKAPPSGQRQPGSTGD